MGHVVLLTIFYVIYVSLKRVNIFNFFISTLAFTLFTVMNVFYISILALIITYKHVYMYSMNNYNVLFSRKYFCYCCNINVYFKNIIITVFLIKLISWILNVLCILIMFKSAGYRKTFHLFMYTILKKINIVFIIIIFY